MKCDHCSEQAVYRVHAESTGLSQGLGGVGRNAYSCREHKEGVLYEVDQQLISTGHRHLFGEVRVTELVTMS